MVKIIKGRKYDTDTAREVGSYSNAGGWRDFGHFEETLFCKRTGEYFLFGEGGPMTKYRETVGQNEWSGGSKIIPLDFDEAREWAEKNLTAEEYEAEFGEVTEDDSRAAITITLPTSMIDTLKREAVERHLTLSAWLEKRLR